MFFVFYLKNNIKIKRMMNQKIKLFNTKHKIMHLIQTLRKLSFQDDF